MIEPATINLAGDRWVPFIRQLPIVNATLTGASFIMQLRLSNDAAGAALVDMAGVASIATQGVSIASAISTTITAHIAAGRLAAVPGGTNPATGFAYVAADVIFVTVLGIRINEAVMEALPFPAERGDNVVLYWDLHITPSGGTKDKYAGGKFIVRSGASQ